MRKNKLKKRKEPGLLSKILHIYYEQAKRRKALRILSKHEWSVDFLAMVLIKACKYRSSGMCLEITNVNGMKLTMTYDQAVKSNVKETMDDNIFNHLDDSLAVDEYIRTHSTR